MGTSRTLARAFLASKINWLFKVTYQAEYIGRLYGWKITRINSTATVECS